MSDNNLDTNHAHADSHQAWAEIKNCMPQIPQAPGQEPAHEASNHADPSLHTWRKLGEHDWDLSVTLGRFDDDAPEHETATERLLHLRRNLNHLNADQLRAYIQGLHSGMNPFFWAGL